MSFGGGNAAQVRQVRALELKLARSVFRATVLELGEPPWPAHPIPELLRDSNPALTPERAQELAAILERELALLRRAREVYAKAVADMGPPPWVGSVRDLLLDNIPELRDFAEALELSGALELELAAAERAANLELRRAAREAHSAALEGEPGADS